MKKSYSKHIIVGAGLSGLTTAYQLLLNGEDDFIILEGRNQIGGRIDTKDGIDLGATWFQDHHKNFLELIQALNVQKFDQYSKGKSVLVYNTMAPAHYFENDSNSPSANRIAGGTIAIVKKLSSFLQKKIHLNSIVIGIEEKDDIIIVKTEKENYISKKVVIAMPPKIANCIQYSPELPKELVQTLSQTHTWMSNAIKVGITFKNPFWRDKKMSGTIIGQVGPVIELYDHCDSNDNTYSLMGFVNEGLREETKDNRKERILSYLEKYLGHEIRDYINYYEKDWSQDPFTSCENLKSIYMSPQYGNSLFNNFYMNNKLLFSGTETSPVYGGYLEGAVYSGKNAATQLLLPK